MCGEPPPANTYYQPPTTQYTPPKQLSINLIVRFLRVLRNPAAPACQGHQGCGSRVDCLSINSQSLLSKLSGYAVIFLDGSKYPMICVTKSLYWDLAQPQKTFCFQICSQGLTNQKNPSQDFKKTIKIHPEIHEHTVSMKNLFLQYLSSENKNRKSQTSKIRYRNRSRNNLGTNPRKTMFDQC